ncbi:MAG: hypothetical protein HOD63_12055 [Bacteroidetes bacterium]|nr:hypothetical protein [Bacteroidota bacterium]MBT3424331.1 hypothetical protein [Bacteroidota bacterium]MBT3802547.1 hypothetical protein [Bacteroidota bacterium]MBT3933125.1 hypothetical protein [Bacteroidota bacterium]MBT4339316.1 hypothetical protein [Bacteroidota bacterium]
MNSLAQDSCSSHTVMLFVKNANQKSRMIMEEEKVKYKLIGSKVKDKGLVELITDSSFIINGKEIQFNELSSIVEIYKLPRDVNRVLISAGIAQIVIGASGIVYKRIFNKLDPNDDLDGFVLVAMITLGIQDLFYAAILTPFTFKRFDLEKKWTVNKALVSEKQLVGKRIISGVMF